MFFNKRVKSEEFETLNRKIILLVGDVDTIKTEVANLKTSMNSLRGFVNRKGNLKPSEDLEESEDLNNSVLLSSDGRPINSKQRIGLS